MATSCELLAPVQDFSCGRAATVRPRHGSVVPYSCIPPHLLAPLSVESTGEYTLDETQFPGLGGEEHRRQPALIIAQIPSPENSPLVQNTSPANSNITQALSGQSLENHYHYAAERTAQWTVTSSDVCGDYNLSNKSAATSEYSQDHLSKAREDLLSVLLGLQDKPFSKLSNPFDAMPALLSAVTFDYVPRSNNTNDSCQSRLRAARYRQIKRRAGVDDNNTAQTTQKNHFIWDNQVVSSKYQNYQQHAQTGNSRKRSYHVDLFDDPLMTEFQVNKRQKIVDSQSFAPPCWFNTRNQLPSCDPVFNHGGSIGIMGY